METKNLMVIKRTGEKVAFEASKITKAYEKAMKEVEVVVTSEIKELITLRIVAKLQNFIIDGQYVEIEKIQDCVEETLSEMGFYQVARAYAAYRDKHAENRKPDERPGLITKRYLDENDWRKKENSTVTTSLGGLILYNSGRVTADYWLHDVYDKRVAKAHENAEIHIHDLSMLSGYCAGWSLKQLIQVGINGVEGRIASAPAKHLHTLCNQMVNFLGIMQNEWAGAQAFSSFDSYLAPFVREDNLSYDDVKQCVQSFVYGVNTPSRWGTQAPFSNITLDWVCPPDLAEEKCIVGGEKLDYTYADVQKERDMVNKAFLEIMLEGDANGRGFQYPIPTYSITKEFDWSDTENNRLLFEMAAKYGTPYFSNYVNSDMNPSDTRSMCCRLRLDLRELRRKSGGMFGSGESTGSVGVVTINMPRIAYLSKDEKEFFERLDDLMDISAASLKVKRNTVEKLMKDGLFPYTKAYLGGFDNHFSTIGLVGMNEACLNANWLKVSLVDEKAQEFTQKVLNHMRDKLVEYQERYGDLYNLESTPAESTAYRFARHDKEQFSDIITAGTDESPYYTNSSNLPVDATSDMFEALDVQDKLQTLYTGGTVFHAFLGEKLPDWEAAAKLVKAVANNYKLPYFTLSPIYSVCKKDGYITGEHCTCPKCGAETEVYSRITGYYRPVKNWNIGKTQEFKERKMYTPNFEFTDDSSANSCEKKTEQKKETVSDVASVNNDKLIIVSTPTCPNCKILKAKFESMGIVYEEVDAVANPEFCEANNIVTAPTCIYQGKIYPRDSILSVL